jgi:hypothetical protein
MKLHKDDDDDEAAPAAMAPCAEQQGGKDDEQQHDEDDRKPPATAGSTTTAPAKGASTTSPTTTSTTTLRLQRSFYADAFLARCDQVDPDDFDLPNGTYICPWMPAEPVEETYYGCGNMSFGRPNMMMMMMANDPSWKQSMVLLSKRRVGIWRTGHIVAD